MSESRSVMSDSLRPHSQVRILQVRILEWIAFPFSRESHQPRAPTVQVDSLPAEPQGKPKSTEVGWLSLLQGSFPTQKSNCCLFFSHQLSSTASCPSLTAERKGAVTIRSIRLLGACEKELENGS